MIDTIHAAGVIFEDEEGNILVLRRHPDVPEGGTWGIVGGKLEADESPMAAAIREVKEEISHTINPADLQFMGTYSRLVGSTNISFSAFRLKSLAKDVTLDIDQSAHTEHMWVNPRELYRRKDLMAGLYPILEDVYRVNLS